MQMTCHYYTQYYSLLACNSPQLCLCCAKVHYPKRRHAIRIAFKVINVINMSILWLHMDTWPSTETDGLWSSWSDWTQCSRLCHGRRIRSHSCDNPLPVGWDRKCPGRDVEYLLCAVGPDYCEGGYSSCFHPKKSLALSVALPLSPDMKQTLVLCCRQWPAERELLIGALLPPGIVGLGPCMAVNIIVTTKVLRLPEKTHHDCVSYSDAGPHL